MGTPSHRLFTGFGVHQLWVALHRRGFIFRFVFSLSNSVSAGPSRAQKDAAAPIPIHDLLRQFWGRPSPGTRSCLPLARAETPTQISPAVIPLKAILWPGGVCSQQTPAQGRGAVEAISPGWT